MMKRCLAIILAICMTVLSVDGTAYAYGIKNVGNISTESTEVKDVISDELEMDFGDTIDLESSSSVNTAMKNKILALKSKFPEGKNWDPSGKGWNNRAWECYGFAITMAGQIFKDYPTNAHIRKTANGKKVEGWTCYYVTKKNYDTLVVEPGDILDCPTSKKWNHTAMVLSVDNGKITCVQANNGGNNYVYWTNCFNYNSSNSTLKNIYNKYVSYITGSGSKVFRLWKPSEELKAQALGISKEETSALAIGSAAYPGEISQGKSWTCKGKVTSNYKINQVSGYILSSDNSKVLYSKTINPGAKSYSLANGAIDRALLFNKLPIGTYNYKITAKDASGKTATLVNTSFKVVGVSSTLKISGNTALTTLKLGKAWTCNGTVSSNYKLTKVYGAILKSDGVTVAYSKTMNPNSKSFKLAGSPVDVALKFNKLPLGTYYYVVDATDASGKKLNLVKNQFTVQGEASTLKISGNTALTTLKPGKSWTCNGTISSNYKITSVYGAIKGSDGSTVIYSKSINPNAKSYKLANGAIDCALLFNKLSEGTYYYVVDATDASGKKLNLVKNQFTVQGEASTLKISGNSALTTLVQGKSWTCNGTISSNYNLTKVYGAILKSDGVTVVYSKSVNPNAKSYKLANGAVDCALLFNKLSTGTYYYVVDATDASGKKLNLVKNKFTVTKTTGKIYSNPVPAATTIGKGSGAFKANGTHRGVDFSAPSGSPIYALSDGVVVVSTYDSSQYGYGNVIVIKHTDGSGLYSLYAHMSSRSVKVNAKVSKGQVIAKVGSTGYSTGPHLHLELATGRVSGKYLSNNQLKYLVNPLDYINY